MIQPDSGPVTYVEKKLRKSVVADSMKNCLDIRQATNRCKAYAQALKHAQELTNKMCKLRVKIDLLDVRPVTRIAEARDGLQVIVCVPAFPWIQMFLASRLDVLVFRQFIENDQDCVLYKIVLMPVDAPLGTHIGQAQFLGYKVFDVVAYGSGFGILMKSNDFNEIVLRLQLQKREQFS